MAKSRLQHIRQERLKKLDKLKKLGINPFPSHSQKDHSNQHIIDNFDRLKGKTVSLSGRLVSFRDHGQLIFGHLQDQSGSIQLYIHQQTLQHTDKHNQTLGFNHFKQLVDTGDFVEATGEVTKTKAGEISIKPTKIKLLTKTLRPFPSKRDLLKDSETIFRRRYLDLATNKNHQNLFQRKAKFWRVQREFMNAKGFMEVETPVLEHVTGGADARPFITHMNSLNQDFYLRISTELYQKRLIGGGYEKIYTLGPNFRNEGQSDEHLPEYYQLEWYCAYTDYQNGMKLIQQLFKHIAQQVYGTTQFAKDNHKFDFSNKWQLISYPKVIQDKFNIDIFTATQETMLQIIKDNGITLEGAINKSRLVDNLWKLIRKNISGPAFLIDTPKFISPLSKSKPDNPKLTQRFQAVIAGSELGNGYSELNNPLDQLERFKKQQSARDSGDDEAQMLDIDFVEMLEYGMPPTTGWGHSERLFWTLENTTAREGTLFPTLRHKIEPLTKQIYAIKDPKTKITNKYISLDPNFSNTYPSAVIGYAIIKNVSVTKSNPDLNKQRQTVLNSIRNLTTQKLSQYPQVQSYRQMYKTMGIDWHSRRPSPEALLRRIALGKGLYSINTCVDAYNLIVIKNKVSVGVFDLDKLKLPVVVKIAQGGEEIHLLGSDKVTHIKKGEVSYFDQIGPYNLDYNYRDAKRTAITDQTNNLFINIDGIGDISSEQVKTSLDETINIITKYCGGNVTETGLVSAN